MIFDSQQPIANQNLLFNVSLITGEVRNADRMNQHGMRVLPHSESPWGTLRRKTSPTGLCEFNN